MAPCSACFQESTSPPCLSHEKSREIILGSPCHGLSGLAGSLALGQVLQHSAGVTSSCQALRASSIEPCRPCLASGGPHQGHSPTGCGRGGLPTSPRASPAFGRPSPCSPGHKQHGQGSRPGRATSLWPTSAHTAWQPSHQEQRPVFSLTPFSPSPPLFNASEFI